MLDETKMKAAFQNLAEGQKPHTKVKEGNPFNFSNPAVMRLLDRGDSSNIADVEELVTLIANVRDLFRANSAEADKDEVWMSALKHYEVEFGGPHRFLDMPVLRKVFDDIVVDVFSRPVYAEPNSGKGV